MVVVAMVVAACADPAETAPEDVATLDTAGNDGADADTATDTATDAPGDAPKIPSETADATPPDAGEDTRDEDVQTDPCAFPPPRFGAEPAAVALAADASACGQEPFAWVDPNDMGTVLDTESAGMIAAALLSAAVAFIGSELPREPEHDVLLTKVLYRTQDRGVPIEATALVARPATDLEGPQDVLLVLHGTSGFTDECAPSSSTQGSALAALFASWGYLVVAPDFIGLKSLGEPTGFLHPYLVGQATAIASLDAVRAAGHLEPDALGGACARPRMLVFGGSQGGHAALWVDRLQPYYAPELELSGVVATTPPADELGQVQRALVDLVPATGNSIAILGTNAGWYGLPLSEIFVEPWDVQGPELLASDCTPGSPDGVDSLDDLFQPAILEAAAQGALGDFGHWGCLLRENGLTTTSVDRLGPSAESYGVLFVSSGADELVHTPIERDAVGVLCEQGMPIQFLECAGADHVRGSFWSLGKTLEFLEARQAGETFTTACGVTDPVTCSGQPE